MCRDIYHGDFEKQDLVVNHEVNLYKNRNGYFGRNLATTGCEKKENFDPGLFFVLLSSFKKNILHKMTLIISHSTCLTSGNWWSTYGCGTPHLQKLATRILALTSSSSGCERNWSVFEAVSVLVTSLQYVSRLILYLTKCHFCCYRYTKKKKK